MYHHRFPGNNLTQVKETLRVIGAAIKRGAEDLDIRNHAAALATTARPKDYLGQLRAVYKDFVKRWRYVKDPAHKELVTASAGAIKKYMLALDGIGLGYGKGGGDCDCVTVALGAELLSIGFPLRIATTADPGATAGNLFGHVFIQARVPKMGWISVDPVLFPAHKPLATARHSRIAFWDLQGNLLGYNGNVRGLSGTDTTEERIMYGTTENNWEDLSGYLGFGASEAPREPDPWESVGLQNWGYLAGRLGIINGDEIEQIPVEVIPDAMGIARSPMLELSPEDYNHMKVWGEPYEGMLALGDDGTPYQYTLYDGPEEDPYDGMLGRRRRRRRRRGFFKRLFRRVAKKVRKVAKRIKKGIRKVVSKLPGGKFILKIADKIHKVAMKFVKPLMKFVGKYASKLAPFAALIPGFGPAIAAGLHIAGKVAQVYNKFSKVVKIVGKVGKARTLVSKDPTAIKRMQSELALAARKMQAARSRARR